MDCFHRLLVGRQCRSPPLPSGVWQRSGKPWTVGMTAHLLPPPVPVPVPVPMLSQWRAIISKKRTNPSSNLCCLDDSHPRVEDSDAVLRLALTRGTESYPRSGLIRIGPRLRPSCRMQPITRTARYCTVTLQHLRSRDVDDLKEARLSLIYPPRPTYSRPTCLSFLCLTAHYASPSLDLVSRRPRSSPLGSSPEEFLLYKQSSHLPIAAVAEPSAGHGGALRARAIQGPDASPRLH